MAKPPPSYTRGSTRGSSDATGPPAAASPRASRTSNAATSCPSGAIRTNTSHGSSRRASLFERWITTASFAARPRVPARDVAVAIARDTRSICTTYIVTPARSSARPRAGRCRTSSHLSARSSATSWADARRPGPRTRPARSPAWSARLRWRPGRRLGGGASAGRHELRPQQADPAADTTSVLAGFPRVLMRLDPR